MDFHHVICCTASRLIKGAERSEDDYIQGAGDDSEGWSQGLTPALFWANQARLMSLGDGDLAEAINALVQEVPPAHPQHSISRIEPTGLHVGTLEDLPELRKFDAVIACVETSPTQSEAPNEESKIPFLYLQTGTGKLGSRALRSQLPRVVPFLKPLLQDAGDLRLLIVCANGQDISVGVALSILCLLNQGYSNDQGTI